MSELSDQVAHALNHLIEHDKLAVKDGVGSTFDPQNTGFSEMIGFDERRGYGSWQVARSIRRVLRLHGGKEWGTLQEAMDSVKGDLLTELVPVAVLTLADGVLMGRKPIPVIKKYITMHQLDHLFTSAGFRTESDLLAFSLSGDTDLMDGLRRYILTNVYASGAACGATSEEDSLVEPNEIFDLWMLGGISIVLSLYVAGLKLGKVQEENELLEGILAASDANTEEKKA